MKGIIDRFEGAYAVVEVEDKQMTHIERSRLPRDVREGDVIIIKDQGIYKDKKATIERKKKIDELYEDLFD